MLYNSKWSEIFQACIQFALKNDSKELQPFGTFFYSNVTLWSAAARFFTGPKKGFLSIQMLRSCNLHGEKFWNFFHIFSNQFTTRSYGYMCPKKFFFKNLVLVLEKAVLERIWWKHSLKPLEVNMIIVLVLKTKVDFGKLIVELNLNFWLSLTSRQKLLLQCSFSLLT